MEEHECIIGIWHEQESSVCVTYNNLKEEIKNTNEHYKFVLENYGEYYAQRIAHGFNIKDYLDKRKNTNLLHFDYCPFCGKEIDWKEFRKNI